jgi:2-polyprenyl-3-methyl-5-hydroxy-6-metoxy-1,4-benzoquinol methylase
MHADMGVHELVVDRAKSLLPAHARILDLGAGTLSLRLSEAGFDVVALDVDEAKWKLAEVPFRVLDINKGLRESVDGEFDAVVCVEVIEHIENPWNLLRECRELVRPGGYLILSTPNITSFYSRLLFLRPGRFHQFDSSDVAYGRIDPITSFQLEFIASRRGWKVKGIRTTGYPTIFDFSTRSAKSLLVNFRRLGSYVVARAMKRGWSIALVLRRED